MEEVGGVGTTIVGGRGGDNDYGWGGRGQGVAKGTTCMNTVNAGCWAHAPIDVNGKITCA